MLIDFHPAAAEAFDKLSASDQRDIDEAIDQVYQDFHVGDLLRGGPLRQYDFREIQVVYYVPEPPTHLIICYVQGSDF
ncbi:hypothetical protein AB0K80_30180 [Streptomyces sp. NPDC052682]|uniref:type II toxin-antitoxin system RelE family toxin n=1 Tax=Streptomyces sp. NPDC052682 TaxID=3154954 RepID=UPI00343ABC2F